MKYIYILFIGFYSFSQSNTIGLQLYNNETTEGYTLFTPEKNNSVYLINNCGEKINQWTFTEGPALTCYLLENGNLLRAGRDNLEIRDWNNNLVWMYAMTANGIRQHHDIEPLPNGNILCVVADIYTNAEIITEGRDPSISSTTFKVDKIIELQPIGTNNAAIVWEWKFIDHFIQDFDSSKLNFGIVENHPELIDINFNNSEAVDYTHVNAIDYNAALDQIMISPRHLSEIYIIDHTTTTAEAAGHTGGTHNKGGDILWRWGNPQVYRQGNSSNQKLFFQHDCKWIETGYLDENKISVFNNGGDITGLFSSVHIINPQITLREYDMSSNVFLPVDFEWSWNGAFFGNTVNEDKKSGVQVLPNGNVLICETSLGRFSEIKRNGDHLWSYRNPTGQSIYNQDAIIDSSNNGIFRGEKYPSNYAGFIGKNLTPTGIIENTNTESDNCITSLNVDIFNLSNIQILNPVQNKTMFFTQTVTLNQIQIFDLNSRLVFEVNNFSNIKVDLDLNSGIYIAKLISDSKTVTQKIILQ